MPSQKPGHVGREVACIPHSKVKPKHFFKFDIDRPAYELHSLALFSDIRQASISLHNALPLLTIVYFKELIVLKNMSV